jgi:hypothetical protein
MKAESAIAMPVTVMFSLFLAIIIQGAAAIPAPTVTSKPKTDATPTLPQQVYVPSKEQGKDGWDKAAVVSNYLLVIVGILGIGYAALTFGKLKEQTEAAKNAAEAALRQAQHIETTERAWVIASAQNPDPPIPLSSDHKNAMAPLLVTVKILFENKGNTPAFIKKIATGGCAIPSDQMPDLTVTDQSGELGDIPVVPGHSFGWEHERIEIERAIKIRSGELSLWIYGIVSYDDTFKETRDTGFCFRFEPSSGQWLFSGNPGDNWAR